MVSAEIVIKCESNGFNGHNSIEVANTATSKWHKCGHILEIYLVDVQFCGCVDDVSNTCTHFK